MNPTPITTSFLFSFRPVKKPVSFESEDNAVENGCVSTNSKTPTKENTTDLKPWPIVILRLNFGKLVVESTPPIKFLFQDN